MRVVLGSATPLFAGDNGVPAEADRGVNQRDESVKEKGSSPTTAGGSERDQPEGKTNKSPKKARKGVAESKASIKHFMGESQTRKYSHLRLAQRAFRRST